jgi:hypothetical protein
LGGCGGSGGGGGGNNDHHHCHDPLYLVSRHAVLQTASKTSPMLT